jgi:hypothetical protein
MYLLKQDFVYFFIYDAENAISKFPPTNLSLHTIDINKTMDFFICLKLWQQFTGQWNTIKPALGTTSIKQ